MWIKQLIILCFLCLTVNTAYAACLGSSHVMGTEGSSLDCKEQSFQKKLDQAEEDAEIERRELKYKAKIKKIKNRGSSSSESTGNQIVQNIGTGLMGGSSGNESIEPSYDSPLATTSHQFELTWSAYIFPSMAGFERQMPAIQPNGFSWIYNLSQSFAVVGMYQMFTLHGKQFDPIVEDRETTETITVIDPDTGEETLAERTVTKEFTVAQPGATSAEYTRFLYFAQITGAIGDKYAIYGRLGSGVSRAKVEYTIVDDLGIETDETEDYSVGQPWAFEVGLRRTFGGINTGIYTRIVEGDNGEEDYMKYIDMTTVEFGINVTFGLPSLGMI